MTSKYNQIVSEKYVLDAKAGIWISKNKQAFSYSDGDDAENSIYQKLKCTLNVSCSSDELASKINDWTSEYHLSPTRHNLLIPLHIPKNSTVLELGCGMGAITRYLGEIGAQVTAVEGSFRRACIARERCRDLDNVTIICDNFKHFESNELFDIVTLIGVLEYSPKYIGGNDSIQECLKIAATKLKPEGSLLIAIENRLGLKYWNNCAEDHTGGMFDSIHDNYPPGNVATFGLTELKKILSRSGFASSQFLYLFPDYKLTNVILNEKSFNNNEINFASILGQTSSRDYTGQPYRYFSERIVWHSLEKNDLIPHFANSFLVAASMSDHSNLLNLSGWIAKIYSTSRKATYRTETTIFRDAQKDKITVKKERLYNELPLAEGPLLFNDKIEINYISGTLLSDEILKVLLQRNPYDAFIQKIREYRDFLVSLNKKKNPEVQPKQCSGELIDCTPFNIIRSRDNTLHFIDDEWSMKHDIPLVVVLLRGVFIELFAKIDYINKPDVFAQHLSLKDLIADIFLKIGLRLSEEDIERFCRIEASIQAQVAKSEDLREHLYQVHKSILSLPVADALNIRTRLPLWELYKIKTRQSSQSLMQTVKTFDNTESSKPASIVILTFNSSKTITQCLKSVIQTLRPYDEVIVVDNDSIDSTIQLIENCIMGNKQFTLIKNNQNLGFSAGTNVGIRICSNPYIVLLNPDTTVSKNWLDRLLAHFGNLTIGAVGPVSTYVAGLQKMELYQKEPIAQGSDINEVAQLFFHWNKGRSVETKLLIGFCMAVRRDLSKLFGPLDEQLFLGNDDLELSWRLRAGGYHLKVATDTFIHHEGQQSFNTVKKEITSRLVQESTDALYRKLQSFYGMDHVPLPHELWGIDWFTPTNAVYDPTAKISDIRQKPFSFMHTPKKEQTSIIILTFNELKYTKECVESIQRHTTEPHEIVFIDNGSTDGTIKWLSKLTKTNHNYRLIQNCSNLGFAKGCNQGIESSQGEFVLLLNNDVIVTEGWLSGMLESLKSNSDIGIVGPMTNNISGTQKDSNATYKTITDMHTHAKSFREKNRHRRIPLRRIVGFCMLFRREFVEKVGLLDESFGTGNFEDDDYCLRASLEGYQNMVAGDVFIHHYGSRSFIGNRIDYGSAMAGNRKVFNEKWSGINSGTELGKKLLISSALENADELSQQGKVDKAVEKYIEGIGQSPETLEIYHALAGMLLEAKRYQESLDALKSMPDEGKGNIKTIVLSGYCAEGLGRYQEAEEYADFVLEKDSGNAFTLNLKGMLAYKRDDRKTADISFKKAIETDPGYGEPYTNLGVLQWSKGDREAGISLLEKGFILSPKVMDIATMYHAALCEMRAFERGEKIFREAKGLYPQNQRIVFLLVDLLLQQGKEKIAMEEIEEAMTKFAVEDGLLAAALAVREKVGAEEIDGSKKKGTLSLSMIVKNEEQHIAKCLMSMKPVVNEMIVVDTGSTDRTKNIAKALGAKVYDFNWTGDFSTARNHSLSKVSGEWILSLDADEVISARDYNAIKEIVGKGRQAAYKIVTRNYSTQVGAQGFTSNTGEYPAEEAGLGWFPSGKVRLFPNNNHIRFENPVHEFVEGTVTKAGIPIKTCDITVHHYGRLNMEKVQEKGEAYYLLGMKKLVEKGPSDLKALFELGVQAGELKKYKEAAKLFEKLVGLDPNYPLALFNLGFAYLSLGRYEEALEYSKRAFEIDPSKKECAVNYAHCEIVAGNIKKGISLLEETLGKTPEYPPAMVVLASAYAIEGRKQAGIDIIEKLHANRFDCANCLHDLADGLFIRSRYQHAMSLYELIVRTRQLHNDTRERIDRCYEEMCKAGMA